MTVRLGIAGIRGRMGREIAALAAGDSGFVVAGGLSRHARSGSIDAEIGPVFAEASDLLPEIDVLIDFTAPSGAVNHARACAAAGVPMVSGTTGLDAEQTAVLRAAAEHIALFQAANMSPGMNAAIAALPLLIRALAGYDVEIVEAHHRYKADAPSGTALALARVAAEAIDRPTTQRHGRHGERRRDPNEIGIHAVRGGENPGEHTVILAGDGEEVRLSVRAFSRAAYAQGALRAARLLASVPPGWYDPATLPGFL
jgi:4-hydroxy-tetrahydrodipicolinate reductase